MALSPHRIKVADTWEEKRAAALQVIQWGYPRSISALEVELAFWIHYGPTAIYWYHWVEYDRDCRRLVLHLCQDPEKRGSIFARRWMYSVGIIGEILNAHALFIQKSVGEEPIFGYLERMGWEPHEGGFIYHLNEIGDDDGRRHENPEAPEARPGRHLESLPGGSR